MDDPQPFAACLVQISPASVILEGGETLDVVAPMTLAIGELGELWVYASNGGPPVALYAAGAWRAVLSVSDPSKAN